MVKIGPFVAIDVDSNDEQIKKVHTYKIVAIRYNAKYLAQNMPTATWAPRLKMGITRPILFRF